MMVSNSSSTSSTSGTSHNSTDRANFTRKGPAWPKNPKYPTTAMLCRELMREHRLSARGVARKLRIHHRTFQDYLQGRHRPAPHIRVRIAHLAGDRDYEAWVNRALEGTQKPFFDRIRQRRLQEKAAVRLKAVEAGNNASLMAESHARIPLSSGEAEYLRSKMISQLYELKKARKKAARLLEAHTLYLMDDRVSEALGLAKLQHSQSVLELLQYNGAPTSLVDRQRSEVDRIEAAYKPLAHRTDAITHASLRLERLALAEMDAAIRLREVELEVLGG